MKPMWICLLLTACYLAPAASPHAQEAAGPNYPAAIAAKAGSGLANIAAGWMEIPRTISATSRQNGIAIGMSAGLFRGIANTLGRTVMGVADFVTFPIPSHPLLDPPWPWQGLDRETRFNQKWELAR